MKKVLFALALVLAMVACTAKPSEQAPQTDSTAVVVDSVVVDSVVVTDSL